MDWCSPTPSVLPLPSFLSGLRVCSVALGLNNLITHTSRVALSVQQGRGPYLSEGRSWCSLVVRFCYMLTSLPLLVKKTSALNFCEEQGKVGDGATSRLQQPLMAPHFLRQNPKLYPGIGCPSFQVQLLSLHLHPVL